MYSAYIFDFDYTLVNSEEGIAMCFDMLFADEGYAPVPRPEIYATIGMPMYEAMAKLTGEKNSERILELIHLYKIRYSDFYMVSNTHLYEDAKSTLQFLTEKGASCYIVSSKTRSRIQETIVKENLTAFIHGIIGVEDVQTPKPSPEGIKLLCRRYDIVPDACLYIGDSTIDAQTAVNSGIDFAAVTTGVTPATAFANFPHIKIMQHLQELTTLL